MYLMHSVLVKVSRRKESKLSQSRCRDISHGSDRGNLTNFKCRKYFESHLYGRQGNFKEFTFLANIFSVKYL